MRPLKISIRLAILIGIFSMLLIAIGSLGLFGILHSNTALQGVHEDRTMPTGQRAGIQEKLLRNQKGMDGAMTPPAQAIATGRTAEVPAASAENTRPWAPYLASALSPEEEKRAQHFSEARTRLLDQWMQLATAALQNNDVDTARRLLQAAAQGLGTVGQTTGTDDRERF